MSGRAAASTTIFFGTEKPSLAIKPKLTGPKETIKKYCPYCGNIKHSLNACNFKKTPGLRIIMHVAVMEAPFVPLSAT